MLVLKVMEGCRHLSSGTGWRRTSVYSPAEGTWTAGRRACKAPMEGSSVCLRADINTFTARESVAVHCRLKELSARQARGCSCNMMTSRGGVGSRAIQPERVAGCFDVLLSCWFTSWSCSHPGHISASTICRPHGSFHRPSTWIHGKSKQGEIGRAHV